MPLVYVHCDKNHLPHLRELVDALPQMVADTFNHFDTKRALVEQNVDVEVHGGPYDRVVAPVRIIVVASHNKGVAKSFEGHISVLAGLILEKFPEWRGQGICSVCIQTVHVMRRPI
jgi:hypothetical protein